MVTLKGPVARGLDLLLGNLAFYGALVAVGVFWLRARMKKTKHAAQICTQSAARAEQLLADLRGLEQGLGR